MQTHDCGERERALLQKPQMIACRHLVSVDIVVSRHYTTTINMLYSVVHLYVLE